MPFEWIISITHINNKKWKAVNSTQPVDMCSMLSLELHAVLQRCKFSYQCTVVAEELQARPSCGLEPGFGSECKVGLICSDFTNFRAAADPIKNSQLIRMKPFGLDHFLKIFYFIFSFID